MTPSMWDVSARGRTLVSSENWTILNVLVDLNETETEQISSREFELRGVRVRGRIKCKSEERWLGSRAALEVGPARFSAPGAEDPMIKKARTSELPCLLQINQSLPPPITPACIVLHEMMNVTHNRFLAH